MEVYKLEEFEKEVTVSVGVGSSEEAGRAAPEVRVTKSSESRKREK